MRSPELSDLELDLIHDLHERTHAEVRYLVSDVRTYPELHLITQRLNQQPYRQSYVPALWLLCRSPITITHLSVLTRDGVSGVVLDLDALHQAWYGLDPSDHDGLALYPADTTLLEWIIDHACQVARQAGVQVVIRAEQLTRDVEEYAKERGVVGVIRPKLFPETGAQN
jgi:hypothetical protein